MSMTISFPMEGLFSKRILISLSFAEEKNSIKISFFIISDSEKNCKRNRFEQNKHCYFSLLVYSFSSAKNILI